MQFPSEVDWFIRRQTWFYTTNTKPHPPIHILRGYKVPLKPRLSSTKINLTQENRITLAIHHLQDPHWPYHTVKLPNGKSPKNSSKRERERERERERVKEPDNCTWKKRKESRIKEHTERHSSFFHWSFMNFSKYHLNIKFCWRKNKTLGIKIEIPT